MRSDKDRGSQPPVTSGRAGTVTMERGDADVVLRIGAIAVRAESYAVSVNGRLVNLSAKQFRLLWALASAAGHVVSSASLSEQADYDAT